MGAGELLAQHPHSCRMSGFGSQAPHGSLHLSVTPVPVDLITFSSLGRHHAHPLRLKLFQEVRVRATSETGRRVKALATQA